MRRFIYVAIAISAVIGFGHSHTLAQVLIEQWRVHYNTVRPHSALGYRPPAPEIILPGRELPMNHEAA